MTKTDSSRMHCGHCGASVRVRVNGTPFVHDDPSTGKRCETTPHRRRSLGQLPDSGEPLTAQFSVSMGQARLARLDAMCDRLDRSRAQIVRDALDAYDPDGGAR